MHIIELRAQNYARLSAITIRPDGALVQISGRNSSGKSSTLNAIWVALKGRAVAPPKPIHQGTEQAIIRLDLGEMVITRTFKADKHDGYTTDLKVSLANGSRVGAKPQQLIDGLLGDLSFDPLAFARLPAKEQFERVKSLVPDFNFDDNAAQRQNAYDERTAANRKAKDSRSQAAGIALPPGPKPKEANPADLIRKLNAATEQNNQRAALIADCERFLNEAERLRVRADSLEADAARIQKRIDAMPAIDTASITTELAGAQDIARIRRDHEERERHEHQAEEAERLSATLTAFIEQCDKEKRDAIAKAKMPVQGLSFGDDEVLLNGLPFSQAGTAEKIRASVGIGIALNPELRVMLIDEGSELDSESLKLVAELAERENFQVWLAKIQEDEGGPGFHIVDGHVAEQKEAAE